MRDTFIIFKKEIKRFFTDYRMLAALFIPGIIIFVIYSFLGDFMGQSMTDTSITNSTYRIAYTNNYNDESNSLPLIIQSFIEVIKEDNKENSSNNSYEYYPFELKNIEEEKNKLKNNEYDLVIEFSNNFEKRVFDVSTLKENVINLYYNGASKLSSSCYSLVRNIISPLYNNYLINYDLKNNLTIDPDIGEENYLLKQIISTIFPLITISLLISTITAICPEAIAGEKERRTLASLLVTPAKRSSIILGKTLALTLTAIASGAVSFLGVLLSLPKMMGTSFTFDTPTIIGLFFVIIVALILFVSIGLLISTFSKSIKEASTYTGPFMVALMVISILPSFIDVSSIAFAFIPLFNIASSMNLLLTGNISFLYLLITALINLVFALIIIFINTKLFDKEKIIYS